MKTIIIYHGGCRDGFASAWIYNKYIHSQENPPVLENYEYFPGFYGQEPPDVKDRNVVILDFCYDKDTMWKICQQAKSLIWIDHHKTATEFRDILRGHEQVFNDVRYMFDLDKSGAGLTWDYFFPSQPRPWLVDYVEDRDLWARKLFASNAVNAYIACLKFYFKIWDIVNEETSISQAVGFGQIAEMKTEQYVTEVCKNVYFVSINGTNIRNRDGSANIRSQIWYDKIPVVNICQVDCSEVLHELCKLYPDSPFSLYWFKRQDGLYQYGMRSIGDFDVSTVAVLFGGGGHKNAAGFQLSYLLEELR